MHKLLSSIESPRDLDAMSLAQLGELAEEIRDVLCNLVTQRTAHFASNLGVVELCLALHTNYDFSKDRLIWDTGHQIYPHKLITGRYHEFGAIRTRGGLMGYPNPAESVYDLFMTGHAGSSVSTVLGLKSGDDLLRPDEERHSVAVIGDGAFPSGIVFEAMNNAAKRGRTLVILNDNEMSICPRVGGIGDSFDRLRTTKFYTGLKTEVIRALDNVPVVGDSVEKFLGQFKEAVKAGLHGGMLFEELGFHYVGPIDGHNLAQLDKYLKMVKDVQQPTLLHVVTEKGHGFRPAAEDPVFFHTPAPFQRQENGIVPLKQGSSRAYTNVMAETIEETMEYDDRVVVMTAAMCQGTKLQKVRERFPDRFFDTGICEGHTVAFAAGQAKAGLRPIVNIYSTFLQRSYDQIFQEVALQNLPVIFTLDRAGLTGPDGPTHHGMFDVGYLRVFPNLVVMAPGDEQDVAPMLNFALNHDGPTGIRYPKASVARVEREVASVTLGKSETISSGTHGTIFVFGSQLSEAVAAAEALREEGIEVGVVNARFAKPLDKDAILAAARDTSFLVTVEEAALMGGFGSAVLELLNDEGLETANLRRLGVPDEFVEHGERAELLASLGLDQEGIAATCREMAQKFADVEPSSEQRQAS